MTNKELEERIKELEKRIGILTNKSQKKQLSEFTPKELKELAESGDAQNVLDPNSTIEIELITGTKVKLGIMGFNHDTKANGSKAGITFGLIDCLDVLVPYNHECTNKGGWAESYIREVCEKIIKLLPKEWQDIIEVVNKTTYCAETENNTQITTDRIFIPSVTEVTGEYNCGVMEGEQYEYYKDENNRIKCCGGNKVWWDLRSPNSGNSNYVSGVSSNGVMSNDNANSTNYVAPCFAI